MLAKEYAKACYDLASSDFLNDYQEFLAGLRENKDYYKLMSTTTISKDQKKSLLEKILKGSLLNLMKVLIDNNRFYLVEDIYQELQKLVDEANQVMRLKVVSSKSLTKEEEGLIAKRLGLKFKKKILLETKVDPSLISGLKIMYQDKLIDDTVLNDLLKMKNNLKEVS